MLFLQRWPSMIYNLNSTCVGPTPAKHYISNNMSTNFLMAQPWHYYVSSTINFTKTYICQVSMLAQRWPNNLPQPTYCCGLWDTLLHWPNVGPTMSPQPMYGCDSSDTLSQWPNVGLTLYAQHQPSAYSTTICLPWPSIVMLSGK